MSEFESATQHSKHQAFRERLENLTQKINYLKVPIREPSTSVLVEIAEMLLSEIIVLELRASDLEKRISVIESRF